MNSEDAIQWQTAMENTQVSEEELCELGQMFLKEAPRMLSEIRDALSCQDVQSLRRAAHTLKSSCAVFEASSATESARRIETCGKQENLEEARDALPNLEQELDRVIAAIAAHLDSTRTAGE